MLLKFSGVTNPVLPEPTVQSASHRASARTEGLAILSLASAIAPKDGR